MPRAKPKPSPTPLVPEMNGPPSEVMTLGEVAAYLRLPEGEIVSAVHAEGLPARYVGGQWRFLKPAIQEWLATGEPTPQTRRAAQLALVGKYKDDPDLMRILEEAMRARGRRPTEDE
jgi:excisionase family DNA binding protein